MKILLTAINAKYIHSNLALYSLRAYAKEYREHLCLVEYTINHRLEFILQEIYKQKPDAICFSCYIWNLRYVRELITELHKLLPQTPIWAGGPEVSWEPEVFLERHPEMTGVMVGEGEASFRDLCRYYVEGMKQNSMPGTEGLQKIPGLVFWDSQGALVRTPEREPLEMDALPFCYDELEEFENRIIYYETSRGCPFSCSYCLSSLEKKLRFRSLDLVKQELQFFLDHKVPQVKFVDRTFNCSREHAMGIWRYLREHDNGVTNFHFELSADLLTEEETTLLASLRPGFFQFEIGVQSTHLPTIQEIRRRMDLSRLQQVVKKLQEPGNVHQHLDLIAGLPLEDFAAFAESFRQVYSMKPEQLQLGFLKVLKGSWMYQKRKDYGLVYQENPPYEVMATRWLSYGELLDIKLAEEMLEVYYNSGQFGMTMKVLELTEENPFHLFLHLGKFYESRGLLSMSHSRIRRCEILLEYIEERDQIHKDLYQETLTFDLYHRENMKSRPAWAPPLSDFKEIARKYWKQGKRSHVEPFWYDLEQARKSRTLAEYPAKKKEPDFYLFTYEKRDPLTGQGTAVRLVSYVKERDGEE